MNIVWNGYLSNEGVIGDALPAGYSLMDPYDTKLTLIITTPTGVLYVSQGDTVVIDGVVSVRKP